MSPTPIDHTDRNALIVALLEECPYTTQELERRVGRGMNMVLPALARHGIVKQCGDHRWALPDFDEATLVEYPRVDPIVPAAAKADGTALREPHERPPTTTVKKDAPLSWWATAPPEGFTAVASAHTDRMRDSKEHRLVPHRTLQ